MLSRDSVRFWVLIATAALASALWSAAASAESDLADHINDEYKGKAFILRGFYSGDHLKYDSNGHILNPTVPDDWTVAGIVQVKRLKVSGDHLRIDARRVHLGWLGGVFQELHDQVGKLDKDEKADRSLRMDVDLGAATTDAAEAALSQIFLTSRDKFADLVPDYWKPCVRAALVGEGAKQYSGCHFSAVFANIPAVVANIEAVGQTGADTAQSSQGVSRINHGETMGTDPAYSSPGNMVGVGHGVSAPRVISRTDPEFSEPARRAKYQGTSVFMLIVDKTGEPRDIRVVQPLGAGLDRKAVETISKWRFDPAQKDGQPVDVEIAVEVDFHLY